MNSFIEPGREALARFLYLEPVLRNQKVLIIGRESEILPQIFRKLGCLSAKIYSPTTEPMPGWDLSFLRGKRDSALEETRPLPFADSSFDIIFIPELEFIEDYRGILSECARIGGGSGITAICARNAECTCPVSQTGLEKTTEIWSLQSLNRLAKDYFKFVENVGQCPFLAYSFVSYDPARVEEGIRLDTSLMEQQSEEAEFFLLLCSQSSVEVKITNAIYQVPMLEMTLWEAVEGEEEKTTPSGAEVEMLRREISEKNILISRLKKEIERLENEAEQRRQKLFEMRQKMQQEKKGMQKEVLEKAIQKQVEKIPETWISERQAMMRQIEELKSHTASLERIADDAHREAEKLKEQIKELKDAEAKKNHESEKQLEAENRKLKETIEEKQTLINQLLHELELQPVVVDEYEYYSSTERIIEIAEKLEKVNDALNKKMKENGELSVKLTEAKLCLDEEKMRHSLLRQENETLKSQIKDLIASNEMLMELLTSGLQEHEKSFKQKIESYEKQLTYLNSIIEFALNELKETATQSEGKIDRRQIGIIWVKIKEKQRLMAHQF